MIMDLIIAKRSERLVNLQIRLYKSVNQKTTIWMEENIANQRKIILINSSGILNSNLIQKAAINEIIIEIISTEISIEFLFNIIKYRLKKVL